jgi:hypothetical protein
MTQQLLRETAALLRRRAAEATRSPDERWMVDPEETGALVSTRRRRWPWPPGWR